MPAVSRVRVNAPSPSRAGRLPAETSGVLRAMRKMSHRPEVVVLTNFALSTYRDSALALGARHFLDKSRDYERLPGILTELAAARAS